MTDRAEKIVRAGRVFYHSNVDAQGYPNGMAYWEEMNPNEKYWWCMLALGVLEDQEKVGFCQVDPDLKLGKDDRYGEGVCAEVNQFLVDNQEKEKAEFEARVRRLSSAFAGEVSDLEKQVNDPDAV